MSTRQENDDEEEEEAPKDWAVFIGGYPKNLDS